MTLKVLSLLTIVMWTSAAPDPHSVSLDVDINIDGESAAGGSSGGALFISPEACQKSGECFFIYTLNQCFCYLNCMDNPANYTDAQSVCFSHGWQLPHPVDVVALRSGLFQWCGNCGDFWLGAKCSGNQMFWKSPVDANFQTSGVIIKTANPYFAPPPPQFADGICLEMHVTAEAIEANADKPYYVDNCSDKHSHILCQKFN